MKKSDYRFSMKGKYIYLISFLIPVAVFLVYMVTKGLKPFGENSLLLGDAHAQIYPFLLEMYHKIHSGDSLFYSWNMGIGTNYYANMVYYLMSPINWLLMLLPESMLEVGMSFSIVFRIALCAVTATFYFMHTDILRNFKYQRAFSLLFGLSYGLSSAVLCYFFLSMWLDVYYLLPLLLWALEKLVEKGAWKWYYVLLVLVICSNFYMAVPICIFLVFWFFLHVDKMSLKSQFFRFAGASLLAATSAMVCLLPVLSVIVNKKQIPTAYNYWRVENFIDVINSMLPMTDIDFTGAYFDTYNVYCGGICLLFALYYILFSKDNRWKRIRYSVFVLFMLFSMNSHLLSFMWHGFSLPHGYDKRFAYLVVFVVIYTACMGLKSAMEATKVQAAIWGGLCVVLLVAALLFNTKMGSPTTYVVSMFVVAIAAMTVYLYSKKSIPAVAYIVIFIGMGMIELVANAGYNLTHLAVENWRSSTNYNCMENVYKQQESETGRVANDAITIHNAGSAFDVNAGDAFSSLLDKKYLELYERLGLYYMRSGAAYCYFGATPLTDMLFNIEKKITKNPAMYSGEVIKYTNGLPVWKKSLVEPVVSDEELQRASKYAIVRDNSAVGYGFVADASDSEDTLASDNAFDNQNKMFQSLGGKGKLFRPVDLSGMEVKPHLLFVEQRDANSFDYANSVISDLNGHAFDKVDYEFVTTVKDYMVLTHGTVTMQYEVTEDIGDLYLYVKNTLGAILQVKVDDVPVTDFNSLYYNMTIHVGAVKQGQKIELVTGNNLVSPNQGTLQIYAADFDREVFNNFYESCKTSGLHVQKMDGNGLQGEFTTDEDGMLYLSVVDDGGFTVYIDGEETEHELLADSMICVPVTAGTHRVTLRYCPPGFKVGLLISLFSLCGAVIIWNMDKIKKKRQA